MATHVREVWQVAGVIGTCEAQIQFPISCHFLRKRAAVGGRVAAGAPLRAHSVTPGLRPRILKRAYINAKSVERFLSFRDA